MKSIVLVVAISAIAACSPSETAEKTEAPVETVEAAPAILAADGGPSVGMYRVTDSEGKVDMEDVRADGTYVSKAEDGTESSGTWEQKSPDVYCTTKAEEGAVQVCHTEKVDEQGVWTSVDPEGKTSTVERVAAET